MALLRIAQFCKTTGEISRSAAGKTEHLIVCQDHGPTPPYAYYSAYQNGYVARDPLWTCLQCFEAWTGANVVEAAKKKKETVRSVKDEACAMCGVPIWGTQLDEGICTNCLTATGGYNGSM